MIDIGGHSALGDSRYPDMYIKPYGQEERNGHSLPIKAEDIGRLKCVATKTGHDNFWHEQVEQYVEAH